MKAFEKVDHFIKSEIEPLKVNSEKSLQANHYVDWLLQKGMSASIVVNPVTDEASLLKDWLLYILNILNKGYSSTEAIIEKYNQKLYELELKIEKLEQESNQSYIKDKLKRIKEILDE